MPLDAQPHTGLDAHNPTDYLGCGSHRPTWICCQTHPQAERWADTNLRRQGFATYLPLVTVTRRDRALPTLTRRVEVPLFRSYLFVDLDTVHWTPIQHTRGVARVLLTNGKPGIIAEAAVDALRAACANPAPEHHWAPGMPCSPVLGPMRGLPAVVLSLHRDTATIGLMFLGELRQISLNVDCLTARDE
jgi:transcriptional antiterminator RfaH